MAFDSDPALPPADIEHARAYLTLLDPTVERFTFFTVDNAKLGWRERFELTRTLHGTIAGVWDELCRLNRAGAGVYVTANETNGQGRKSADIVRVRLVWVDDDKPRDGPRSDFPLAPTVVVATSPGKYQYGWRVAGLTPDDHRGIMRTMVEAYGADPAAVALSCVLRLPGTLHMKNPAAPHSVRIVSQGPGYSASEVLTAFPRRENSPLAVGTAAANASPEPPAEFDAGPVTAALKHIDPDDYRVWLDVGMALHWATGGSAEGYELWDEWSQGSGKHGDGRADPEYKWNSFRRKPDGTHKIVTLGTLFKLARDRGFQGPTRHHDAAFSEVSGAIDSQPAVAASVPLADCVKPLAFRFEDIPAIPPRAWLVDRKLMRQKLSLLVAAGATGKSLLSIQWAIALALGDGRKFGLNVRERVRVLLINLEDEDDEMRRRVAAVCMHFGVDPAWLDGWLFKYRHSAGFLVAERDRSGKAIKKTPRADELATFARTQGIGAIIVDPLTETHDAAENDNGEMRTVAQVYRGIAEAADVAMLLVHHTSKPLKAASTGFAGDINSSRGASALVNAVRIGMTLYGMTRDEAKAWGVPPEDHGAYVRLDDSAKPNLGKRSAEPEWFKWVSIRLPNTDDVGVLAPVSLAAGCQKTGLWEAALGFVIDQADAGTPVASATRGPETAAAKLREKHPECEAPAKEWSDTLLSLHMAELIAREGKTTRGKDAWVPTKAGRAEYARLTRQTHADDALFAHASGNE